MIPNLEEIYCLAENLTRKIDQVVLKKHQVGRKSVLSIADSVTIMIIKQIVGISDNLRLYNLLKNTQYNGFPPLPSYQQFCESLNKSYKYLAYISQILVKINLLNNKNSEYIVDSTKLHVCKNQYTHKTGSTHPYARTGKTLEGYFFGYKLHVIINTSMDILAFKITPGGLYDPNALTPDFVKGMEGVIVGDKGYISSTVSKELIKQNLLLVTKRRKNMKQIPITKDILDLLNKRCRIETVFGQLKDHFQLVNTKARSVLGYLVHVTSAIIAYCLRQNFDLLHLDIDSALSLIS
jgi:hypothetical protein